jgi:TAP-like protein
MIYAWRYPSSIHRSVMIGVNPPGHFIWGARTTDEQIGRYANLCSSDDTCSKRTEDLAASMRRTAAEMPERWWLLPIKEGNVRAASFYGLFESNSEAALLAAPKTLDSWLSAAEGDPSGFWFLSLTADLSFPTAFVWGEYAAVVRPDAQAASDYFFADGQERDSILDDAGAAFNWAGGRLTDAWPAAPDEGEYSRVRTSTVETLLIGGTLDVSTPPQVATDELLPSLSNGQQVVLAELGHTDDFWTYKPQASTRLITTFFASGRVDDSLYTPASVDFTPEGTFTALGKGIAGAMVSFALVAVLSLLWVARWVHTRGRFGRKASTMLRSVYQIVLGLGGWFLGAMIVIIALPGVPLDDELLAVLSVGVAVGLGTYWAWVHRDWSARRKGVGLAAAAAGALVGAWFGFHATGDLLALVTAIVGGAAGANLTLILVDIVRARSVDDRVAPETTDVGDHHAPRLRTELKGV